MKLSVVCGGCATFPGSAGATRSFNDHGLLVQLTTFTDRTEAIMATTIP